MQNIEDTPCDCGHKIHNFPHKFRKDVHKIYKVSNKMRRDDD